MRRSATKGHFFEIFFYLHPFFFFLLLLLLLMFEKRGSSSYVECSLVATRDDDEMREMRRCPDVLFVSVAWRSSFLFFIFFFPSDVFFLSLIHI